MMALFVWLACALVMAGVGYWLGYRQATENMAERVERLEAMLDADPRPTRKAGQPTNMDAEPSRVTSSRRRQGRWKA